MNLKPRSLSPLAYLHMNCTLQGSCCFAHNTLDYQLMTVDDADHLDNASGIVQKGRVPAGAGNSNRLASIWPNAPIAGILMLAARDLKFSQALLSSDHPQFTGNSLGPTQHFSWTASCDNLCRSRCSADTTNQQCQAALYTSTEHACCAWPPQCIHSVLAFFGAL